MSTPLRTRRPARWALASGAAAALLAAGGAASASAATETVTSGAVGWTTQLVYNTAAPTNTERTWIGYVTDPTPRSGANGSATTADGASITGPTGAAVTTIDGTLPRGTDQNYTFGFPVDSGTYDPSTGVGAVESHGTVQFTSAAHRFTLTLSNPQIVLDGLTGQLFGSGLGSNPATSDGSYDRSTPVFNLNLAKATVVRNADGTRTIGPIVPSVVTSPYLFPSNYGPGAGPERTPNTFGSFSVRLRTTPVPPADGAKGETGPAGPAGVAGPAGPAGKTVTRVLVALRTAPWKGSKVRHVSVLRSGKVVGEGTVRGRRLRATAAQGADIDRGSYQLKIKGTSVRKTVRIG